MTHFVQLFVQFSGRTSSSYSMILMPELESTMPFGMALLVNMALVTPIAVACVCLQCAENLISSPIPYSNKEINAKPHGCTPDASIGISSTALGPAFAASRVQHLSAFPAHVHYARCQVLDTDHHLLLRASLWFRIRPPTHKPKPTRNVGQCPT